MDFNTAKKELERFCSFPLHTALDVMREFAALPNAIAHFDGDMRSFVYVPGKRSDRVVLVAHADTVWDSFGEDTPVPQTLVERGGVSLGKNPEVGIGADDRAGCAMLWLLRDSGHSLLIVDGEEQGQIGSCHIRDAYPDIYDELNAHAYMIQLDRRESRNYKVYRLPVSREFIAFVEGSTGYENAGTAARTDIITLCRDICGVNLAIGYHNEHTPDECVVLDEWYSALTMVERILKEPQKRYPLEL